MAREKDVARTLRRSEDRSRLRTSSLTPEAPSNRGDRALVRRLWGIRRSPRVARTVRLGMPLWDDAHVAHVRARMFERYIHRLDVFGSDGADVPTLRIPYQNGTFGAARSMRAWDEVTAERRCRRWKSQ
jgi:hypothetical protein